MGFDLTQPLSKGDGTGLLRVYYYYYFVFFVNIISITFATRYIFQAIKMYHVFNLKLVYIL